MDYQNDSSPGERAGAPVIDYARHRDTAPARVSAMAIWCMVLSLGACPCAIGAALSWLPIRLILIVSAGTPLAIIVLSVATLLRIRRSNGNLDGEDYIYFAITFSSIWLLGLVGFS